MSRPHGVGGLIPVFLAGWALVLGLVVWSPSAGTVTGVPVGTVKSRLFRARQALQKRLYDYAVEMGYIKQREPSE